MEKVSSPYKDPSLLGILGGQTANSQSHVGGGYLMMRQGEGVSGLPRLATSATAHFFPLNGAPSFSHGSTIMGSDGLFNCFWAALSIIVIIINGIFLHQSICKFVPSLRL